MFEVPVDPPDVCPPAESGAVGVDRNAGQATDSTGALHALPKSTVEDAKIKRYQRRMARQQKGSNRRRGTGGKLRKLQRKRARRRDNATHQISRKIADTAHTVVLEDLNTKGMTKSAKGTVENPGRNVKQKAGLNRAILASGWGQLERKLAYKAGRVVFVDPAYTSQACSRCGHTAKSNRPSQAVFACGTCGLRANADHNAALNILVRAGLGLLHGEERSLPGRPCGRPQGLPRPVNRICVASTIVYKSHSKLWRGTAVLVRTRCATPRAVR